MKRWQRSAIALTACLLLAGCEAEEPSQPLTVVGWGGSSQRAHRDAYWTSFVVHTGIPLQEDTWHGGIDVLREKARSGDWDIVQVEVEELLLGCAEGLFEPMDWRALGGREAFIEPSVQDCGVGAMVWSQLFGYDADRMPNGPRNWAEFWDVQRFPGRRGLRRTPKYTLEFALMADGVEPDDVYKVLRTEAGVDRAFRKLDEIKPHAVWWTSISQVPDLLTSGRVIASVTSPGRLLVANRDEGRHFKVVWDGNIYAVDFWVIMKGSRRKSQALRLVQYMKQPEHEARLAHFIPTGLSNRQAIASLEPALRVDTPSNAGNLAHAVELDAQFWVEHSSELTERFEAWLQKR
ncbi:extracellular solute-binding protein [Steroidobacter sp.]|uniref:extracellular solute-binding protein n=1 Tax=Steroidobacter sp. TaxID=1978227 RepID=UPI002ED8C0BA